MYGLLAPYNSPGGIRRVTPWPLGPFAVRLQGSFRLAGPSKGGVCRARQPALQVEHRRTSTWGVFFLDLAVTFPVQFIRIYKDKSQIAQGRVSLQQCAAGAGR